MSGRLEGKKIIVTAAGQGIGKATAIAFHNEGASVTATDLNDKTLADLNKEFPKINVHTLDSTDNKAILEFVKLGATQLTLMLGANSAAKDTVNPSMAAFADAIIA